MNQPNFHLLNFKVPPEPPPVKRPGPIQLIGSTIVGGMVGYFAMRILIPLLPRAEWTPGSRVALAFVGLLAVPGAWWFAVATHEAGHVLGAWLRGGRLLLYQVGPFRVQRTPLGLRLRRNRGINVLGGLAACTLPDRGDLASRFKVMLLGGPLASLSLSFGVWALLFTLRSPEQRVPWYEAAISIFLLLAGLYSAFAFILSAFPYEKGGFLSDGRRFLLLRDSGLVARRETALLSLSFATFSGVRPRNFTVADIGNALASQDESASSRHAHWFAYLHAADRGEWDAAVAHLDALMEFESKLAPFFRGFVRAEYAWMVASRGGDPAVARAWLVSAGSVASDPPTRLKAEAAVLLREGNSLLAAERAREGLAVLDQNTLSPVRNEMQADQFHDLLTQAESSRSSPASSGGSANPV